MLGFESYEEAERYADKVDGSVHQFKNNNGNGWEDQGWVGEPFDMTDFLTYTYVEHGDFDNVDELYIELYQYHVAECDSICGVRNLLKTCESVWRLYEDVRDGQILVVTHDGEEDTMYVTDRYSMSIWDDGSNYEVGVILN